MFADDQRQGEPLFPCVAAMDNNNHHLHNAQNKRRLLLFHYQNQGVQHRTKHDQSNNTPETIGRSASPASPSIKEGQKI